MENEKKDYLVRVLKGTKTVEEFLNFYAKDYYLIQIEVHTTGEILIIMGKKHEVPTAELLADDFTAKLEDEYWEKMKEITGLDVNDPLSSAGEEEE